VREAIPYASIKVSKGVILIKTDYIDGRRVLKLIGAVAHWSISTDGDNVVLEISSGFEG